MKLTLLIVFILYWFPSNTVVCQSNNFNEQYEFNCISTEQGINNGRVYFISQSENGLMWFATEDGVAKYDGYTISTYTSIKSNQQIERIGIVYEIKMSPDSNLWIATDQGILIYNDELDVFEKLNLKYKGDTIHSPKSFCFADERLYFSKRTILYVYSQKTKQVENKYDLNIQSNNNLQNDDISTLFPDSHGNVWIGLTINGAALLNLNNNEFTFFNNKNNTEEIDSYIYSFYEDSSGRLWLGGWNKGLYYYNYDTKTFTHLIPDVNNSNSKRVTSFIEYNKSVFFVGTRNGLYKLDTKKLTFKKYADSKHPISRINNDDILCLFIDNHSGLWVGTYAGGVCRANLNSNGFEKSHFGYIYDEEISRNVNALEIDENNNLWIGSELSGLDVQSNQINNNIHNPIIPKELKNTTVNCVEAISKDNIWIGTEALGLLSYNYKTQELRSFKNEMNESFSSYANSIYSMVKDVNSNLWLSTYYNFYVYKLASKSFINIEYNNEKTHNPFYKIIQDKNGYIWAAGAPGVYRFDTASLKSVCYNNYKGLNIEETSYILEDKKGSIWFSIDINKLVCLNPISGNYKIITIPNSSYNVIFKAFLDDDDGNLWASTNNGIYKFENLINSQDSVIFKLYKTHSNLQDIQFNPAAACRAADGKLFFGGTNGFNSFYPVNVIDDKHTPFMMFTHLFLNNKLVNIGDTIMNSVILKKSIMQTQEIVLTHKIKNISIEFAAIHFAAPSQNKYKYILEGIDDDWVNVTAENRRVSYSTLPAGNYTFKVKGANLNSVWNQEPLILRIKVIPPWWKTKWFLLLTILLFALIIRLVYKLRVKVLKFQKKNLEDTVSKRTKELHETNMFLEESKEEVSQQNDELLMHRNNLEKLVKERTVDLKIAKQKAEESDELKSAFLANMSHEIRTPLNAIVGFSSFIADENLSKEDVNKYVDIIQNNSQILSGIINDIIDISMIQTNQLTIAFLHFNVDEVLREMKSFYELKINKKTKLLFIPDNADESIQINNDIIRFRQIMTNLIDNAIKFTKEGFVKFGYKILDSKIEFFVHDTGPGILPKEKDNIFMYFRKFDTDNSKFHSGIGLGLAISKSLVEQMGGDIWFESEPNKGANFFFNLPYESEKLVQNAIADNVVIKKSLEEITILIVEDEESNNKLINRILSKTKANLVWAKNGKEAVDYIANNLPINNCIILMDIKMPIMNGVEASKEIRKIAPEIPIVAVTAHALIGEREKFLSADYFDDYISKPYEYKSLMNIIYINIK